MKKSKKTLKMLIICIICIAAVVVINMVKKPSDPFQSSNNKLGYQHIEKENLLNNQEEDGDSYYIYFYKENGILYGVNAQEESIPVENP